MVYTCCVPLCRGNYPNTPKVQLFSFPEKDPSLFQKWMKSIPRKDFKPTKYSKVCQLHFRDEDIRKVAEAFDEKTGKTITAPLTRFQLVKSAVPCIFPNCPSYLSTPKETRESPGKRRKRKENETLSHALSESISDYETYQKNFKFSSLFDLCNLLNKKPLPPPWSFTKEKDKVILFIMKCSSFPEVTVSAVINANLELTAYLKKTKVRKLGNFIIPKKIDDINNLFTVVESLSLHDAETGVSDLIQFACSCLNSILEKCDDDKKNVIKFIIEQLNLFCCSKENLKYSAENMVFYSLLYTISPQAYRFMRNSSYVCLPHPRTIQRLCSSLPTNPQNDQSDFLWSLKQKTTLLKDSDRTIILMLDEIYVKPYLDYKGGSIVGMAQNCENVATTVHVLMLQSLLSSFKEVIRILPVKNIVASELHSFVLSSILALEELGYFVVALVTDNNAINRKAMSYFSSPPQVKNMYSHPCNNKRPLFFIIDSVHLFKCIRNNWLNQKNDEQAFYFPDFENFETLHLLTASFISLKKLHDVEKSKLVKYSYGLSLKALFPSSLERQNVKLVTAVFNNYIIEGLRQLGSDQNILNCMSTANFVDIIYKWWCIVNVKTPFKGVRLKDQFQEPLQSESDKNFQFLNHFLSWLNRWKEQNQSTGSFTKETHMALSHTTEGLVKMAKYCLNELNFTYFLPGKVQTDSLEDRFGKYRTLAGSQYLVSVRQVYEAEAKLRLQNLLPLTLNSTRLGKFCLSDIFDAPLSESEEEMFTDIDISVTEIDVKNAEHLLPVLVYLAGYCARAALKFLNCMSCKNILVKEKTLVTDPKYELIKSMDRGGLLCPQLEVVNIVLYNYIIVEKLVSGDNEVKFLQCKNQRQLVIRLTLNNIITNDLCIENCAEGHTSDLLLKYLLRATTNSLLNNYCKKMNDIPRPVPKKRKLNSVTVSK